MNERAKDQDPSVASLADLYRERDAEADFWQREAEHLRRVLRDVVATGEPVANIAAAALLKSTARRAKYCRQQKGGAK